MPYCKYCGQYHDNDAEFCSHCGRPINGAVSAEQNQRKQTFDGEIRKCPNCGATLNAFESTCPTCGYELRGARASNVVQEFSRQLDALNAEPIPYQPAPTTKRRKSKEELRAEREARNRLEEQHEQRKVTFIQNFPIPNTKEDIMEFLILAGANMVPASSDDDQDEENGNTIRNVWASKFEQAYQKAKFSFGNDADFDKITEFYISQKQKLKNIKFRKTMFNVIFMIVFALFIVLGFCALIFIN